MSACSLFSDHRDDGPVEDSPAAPRVCTPHPRRGAGRVGRRESGPMWDGVEWPGDRLLRRVMKPRITLITLGVDDLERALRFYRDGLGLETEGIVGTQFEYGAVAFFDLQAGLKLALWPRASLAHDAGIMVSARSPTEFSLAHNVRSKPEVDAVMAQAARAGAPRPK